MKIKKIKIVHLFIGVLITITGTTLQIYDWWTNFGDKRNSDLFGISILISISGFIITINSMLKNDIVYVLAIIYPFFVMLLYHIFFLIYFFPKINEDNEHLIAVIEDVFEKPDDGGFTRAIHIM